MRIIELTSFPIEQEPDLAALEWRLGQWFAERSYPVRLLACSRGFVIEPARRPLDERAAQLSTAPETDRWPLRWLREASAFYTALERRHLRSATYMLLTWEPPDVSADGLVASISRATRRPAALCAALPPIISGEYQEHDGFLAPERPGEPFLAALISYDMRGSIDATLLHRLMGLPYDIAIAVDVQTPPRARAQRQVELAYSTARAVAADSRIKDARAERAENDSERTLHELTRQGLHHVQIAVLVSGESRAALEAHIAEVRELFGSALRLTRPAGAQAELLRLWSTTPASQIDAPLKRRNAYSQGVGCMAGVLGYHRASSTAGLLYGVDGQRRAPLFLDLFADRQAAHMVILGKSGFGKTFYLNIMTLRAAALAGHRVITLDAFENAARIAAAAGAGANVSWITPSTPINILDIVFDAAEEDWVASQVQHVMGQIALLLGTPGVGADGRRRFTPYQPSIAERSVLERALMDLYSTAQPGQALAHMPRLDDMTRLLDSYGEREATRLADLLCMFVHGTADRAALGRTDRTPKERVFNQPTAIDWRFGHAINCFDFAAITRAAPELLPFYYAQAVGAINRYMRDPQRDTRQRTLLLIDEFGYAAQVEAVGRLAADICKVARKFGIGLMVVDQNPHTFLDSQTGREIFENAAAKVLFHLDDAPARAVGAAISDLTAAHVEFLSHAGRGETLAIFDNDVYAMLVEPNRLELRMFSGS